MRRRTVPLKIPDIVKCSKEGCIYQAELIKCEPIKGGGTICKYTCKNCNTTTTITYEI